MFELKTEIEEDYKIKGRSKLYRSTLNDKSRLAARKILTKTRNLSLIVPFSLLLFLSTYTLSVHPIIN